MTEPVATAREVRFRYGEGPTAVEALRGVSLDVEAGEVLMIRGPSGSGKTTLLQLLGALKAPSDGALTLFGTRVDGLPAAALRAIRVRRIGFVFQSYNLFPTLRAWENVAVSLDLQGVPRAAAQVQARRLLADLGLAERADFYPAKLSGGQRQRVAIARALAHDPTLILCDEPTAALDWTSGRMVTDCLRSLAHDQGRAVVIVSHDARIEPLVDRIVTIEDGLMIDHSQHTPQEARP
ncbi:ABC transporter ATP-binding protein [Methylobacterium nonmethylotrophicum]|uniref:ABC transporter ATP-binding protein n=1 Tax=Methylobacterium nonmethylotrophicum TaxID=1141884 RepID=A0A4Z0NUN1_9HYPH|nr:ABC transporter ATP-binding protein [Methylobacterium nonmethylotrophicum]TGE01246.1 ABC transporter ATP-binding protein [Methylobacterium nonmethylotrophicum]